MYAQVKPSSPRVASCSAECLVSGSPPPLTSPPIADLLSVTVGSFYTSGFLHYILSCDWLLSSRMTVSRFLHVVYIRSLLLFVAGRHPIRCTYVILLIRSLHRHLVRFQFGAVKKKAATTIPVKVFVRTCAFTYLASLPRSGVVGSRDRCLFIFSPFSFLILVICIFSVFS